MKGRDQTADLDKLADAVMESLEWDSRTDLSIRNDFPWVGGGVYGVTEQILELLEFARDGEFEGEACFTDTQRAYAKKLLGKVKWHIYKTWTGFRMKESDPQPQDERGK